MKKIFSVLICILAAVFLLCSCGANVQKIDNSAHNTYPSFEGGTVYNGDTAGSASAENGSTQSFENEKTSHIEEKTSETSARLSEKTDKNAKTEKTDKPTSHAADASQSKTEKEAKNKFDSCKF